MRLVAAGGAELDAQAFVVEQLDERVGERVAVAAGRHQRLAAVHHDVRKPRMSEQTIGVSHAIDSSSVMPNDALVVGQA